MARKLCLPTDNIIVLPVKSSPPNMTMKCRAWFEFSVSQSSRQDKQRGDHIPNAKKAPFKNFGNEVHRALTSSGTPPATLIAVIPPNPTQIPARIPMKTCLSGVFMTFLVALYRRASSNSNPESMSDGADRSSELSGTLEAQCKRCSRPPVVFGLPTCCSNIFNLVSVVLTLQRRLVVLVETFRRCLEVVSPKDNEMQ